MALQRCLFQVSQLSKHCIIRSNLKQSYCALRQTHSRKFTDRHEWIVVDKGTGTVGISNYAQESLGDVVFAQLPEPGVKVNAGDECGALESVKAASEIYSPLSGTITEKNQEVELKPSLINTSCYEKGWLFKLKLTDTGELDKLMTEEQYETFLKADEKEAH